MGLREAVLPPALVRCSVRRGSAGRVLRLLAFGEVVQEKSTPRWLHVLQPTEQQISSESQDAELRRLTDAVSEVRGCGTAPPSVLSPATDVPEVGPQGEVTVHLGAVTTPSPPTEDRSCARAC